MKKHALILTGLLILVSITSTLRVRAETYQAGAFDYYILTLSWSPTYCLTHSNNAQCSKGYGFVLHGLWPQFFYGGWPEYCAPVPPLSAEERLYGLTLFPTEPLLTHEWTKHGTCSGLGAMNYLKTTNTALDSITIPAIFQAPTNPLLMSVQEIVSAFTSYNRKRQLSTVWFTSSGTVI